MWGTLRGAADQFLRNQAAAAIRRTGLPVLRTARDASKSNLTRNLAAGRLVSNVPFVQAGVGGVGAATAIDASNRTGLTGQVEGALNQVGPAVDRFFGAITPQAIQNFGREQEDKGWGGALEMATPFGFLAAPFIPNTPAAKPRMPGLPTDYKQTELAAGAAAERFRPGAGFPGQQTLGNQPPDATPPVVGPQLSPEERAYNAERSRIAQLTEQNPEFQNIGQLRNDLRDQGMAIWAAKYGGPGGLASKVKPGAVGYDAIQRGIGIQSIPSLENRAEFGLDQLTQGPTPAVPMADEMLNPASPGFIGGEGAPPMNFADPRFENMSPEDFQKLLNQVNRK